MGQVSAHADVSLFGFPKIIIDLLNWFCANRRFTNNGISEIYKLSIIEPEDKL